MKLPKKYIRENGGINAAAWRAYKASLKKRKRKVSGTKKRVVKKAVKKGEKKKLKKKTNLKNNIIIYGSTKKRKATTMAKKKKTSKKVGKARRRRVSLMNNRTMNAAIKGGASAIGVIAGLIMVNKLPWVKDQQPWMKALANILLGSIGITLVKRPLGKSMAAGVVTAGALSFLLPIFEGQLSGGSRRLSTAEMQSLRTGKPVNIMGMGKPYSIPTNNQTGRGTRSSVRSRY